MQVTMGNQKRINASIKNLMVHIVHLVKDLLDLQTNVNIQTNSNEHHKVSENRCDEEKEKDVVELEKESGIKLKGT